MIATGAAGMAVSTAKFFEGRAMEKRGEKFIENFEWNDLKNPYEEQQVSTLGSDLRTEQANIGTATATEALRTGGTRALVGGLGRVEAARNTMNRETAAGLDEQQKAIDRAKAQQDVVNQNMIEKRQSDELAGYGQMMNVGMGLKNQGLNDFVNSAGSLAQGVANMQNPEAAQNAPQSPMSSMTPAGATYSTTPAPVNLPWSPMGAVPSLTPAGTTYSQVQFPWNK